MSSPQQEPVIIVGAGLAGLVAAFELAQRGVPVVMVDQEGENSLGGQAHWSLGGLFVVDSAEQQRCGIRDSRELAMRDWLGSARFGAGGDDFWARQWAKAFVDFAADEMEAYVKARGLGFLVNVGWAERGDGTAGGHGNSVPRFHVAWGAGPEVVRVFAEPVRAAAARGLVEFRFRHVVDELVVEAATGRAAGVRGRVLEADGAARGAASSRTAVGRFELRGAAVVVASGGIGGNEAAVRAAWPVGRLGPRAPEHLVVGVPAHVDGRMLAIAEAAGARVVNRGRMWLYPKGLHNWRPVWPRHGVRLLPGPLVAVRLNLLTRKTLGGLETDLRSNARRPDGTPFPGLYAAGEAAGFGGGGVHGYSSLKDKFTEVLLRTNTRVTGHRCVVQPDRPAPRHIRASYI